MGSIFTESGEFLYKLVGDIHKSEIYESGVFIKTGDHSFHNRENSIVQAITYTIG